jgi:hypothetical protein
MSGKLVGLIYFYVVSAAALALIVIGIFSSVNYLINITQFDKYPIRYRSEADCENMYSGYGKPISAPGVIDAPIQSTPSAQEIERLKNQCLSQFETERKQQQIDDLKNSITFTLIGAILFAIHFPLARRQSKVS